jgi:hypothetical protein
VPTHPFGNRCNSGIIKPRAKPEAEVSPFPFPLARKSSRQRSASEDPCIQTFVQFPRRPVIDRSCHTGLRVTGRGRRVPGCGRTHCKGIAAHRTTLVGCGGVRWGRREGYCCSGRSTRTATFVLPSFRVQRDGPGDEKTQLRQSIGCYELSSRAGRHRAPGDAGDSQPYP